MVESKEETKLFTRKEVKDNSNKDNVVIIYDNSVYNVTNYILEHPGGEEVLLDQNGTDATEVFNEVGHSSDAREIMKKFKVGELVPSDRISKTKDSSSHNDDSSFKIEDIKDWKYLLPTALTVLAVAYYMYNRLKSNN